MKVYLVGCYDGNNGFDAIFQGAFDSLEKAEAYKEKIGTEDDVIETEVE